jgi:hypothetical protein
MDSHRTDLRLKRHQFHSLEADETLEGPVLRCDAVNLIRNVNESDIHV